MLVSVPEMWHIQTPGIGDIAKRPVRFGATLPAPASTASIFSNPTLSSSTLSSMAGAMCTFSHFTHWVQWFSQQLGAHFTTSAWVWSHWVCQSRSRPSDVLQELTEPLGWEWGGIICARAMQEFWLCPLEKVADEFPPRIHGCVYTEIPDYFQSILQLWGLWW